MSETARNNGINNNKSNNNNNNNNKSNNNNNNNDNKKNLMIEVNLNEVNGAETKLARPQIYKSVRYYVVMFALISPFVVSFSKTIINFAIIDMIDPSIELHSSIKGRHVANTSQGAMQPEENERPIFDSDNSCPVSDLDRERLLNEMNRAKNDNRSSYGYKFKWDSNYQGFLKAAYSIGHAPLQISGGRLSEIYGPRWVMGLCASAIGVCCLMAPLLAQIDYHLLVANFILMGVFGSFMTPSIFTLFARWLTPGERSQFVSFYLVASRLGIGLSSLICGQMFQLGYSWRHVYFSAGAFIGSYALAFILLVRSQPHDHPVITQLEVDYLAAKNPIVSQAVAQLKQQQQQQQHDKTPNGTTTNHKPHTKPRQTGAPWAAILCSVPVWAFVVTKFCVKLAGDAISIELPIYLQRVMHFPSGVNGIINALNYGVFCLGSGLVGALAKYLVKRPPRGMSKTAIRKCFQGMASFSVGFLLVVMARAVCNRTVTELSLVLMMFFSTFGTGGEIQSPLDLSLRYSGTIHAIASTLAITGVIEPIFVGFFMKGHQSDRENWTRIWLGASAISFFGGLVFLVFADAKVQPFDDITLDDGGHPTKDTMQNGEIKHTNSLEMKPTLNVRAPQQVAILNAGHHDQQPNNHLPIQDDGPPDKQQHQNLELARGSESVMRL